jgi:membrane protein YqaA with SNARE-associated domain
MIEWFLNWAAQTQRFFLAHGPLGLMGIAFLDSAFLPLPQAIDLWVILLCRRDPSNMLLYALCATIGSVAGCIVLYYIALQGGHIFLEKRVGKERAERIRNWFERYEFLTIAVPAMMPPPTPLKAFVITAGVIQVHLGKFVLALLAGRSLRYFVEAWLAVRYGRAVWNAMTSHGPLVGLAIIVLAAAWFGVAWCRRRSARPNLQR